jgi:transcriptional regulator with XRE-family HTH domain/desulfoferrodoxin (superoxide reductase-like protein)
MDCEKIGALISALRKEQNLTQQQLADQLNVSDKAISKWERGSGCPDINLIPDICRIFGITQESLLSGDLDANLRVVGNMKKLKFYVCPSCDNLITGLSEAAMVCCSKKLDPLTPQKAPEEEKLSVEHIENDYFISSEHPMTKSHYVSFVALLTGDAIILRKLYPEWNLQTRIPRIGHGMLIWYCSNHGLFYQYV